jgi:hypothetical protein
MNTKLIITAIAAIVLGAAFGWNAPHPSAPSNTTAVATAASPEASPSTGVAASAPATPAADAKPLYYVCPMHPNIHYGHPGDCPICGMKLQPVYASETNAPVALPSCCGGGTCQ